MPIFRARTDTGLKALVAALSSFSEPNIKQSVKNTTKPMAKAKVKVKASTSTGGYRVYGTLVKPRKRNLMRITAAIRKLA